MVRTISIALAAVVLDHRLLHRMQRPVGPRQMLDSHHMRAVQRAGKADAGIDRFIDQLVATQPSDQHRARPAIPLRAALFAAGPPRAPQPFEQRAMWVNIVYDDGLPIELEHDRGHMPAEYTPATALMHPWRVRAPSCAS